ncbi:MAG TPA: hypothetical protein VGM06_06205 [Polyangiaceae bacterium]
MARRVVSAMLLLKKGPPAVYHPLERMYDRATAAGPLSKRMAFRLHGELRSRQPWTPTA